MSLLYPTSFSIIFLLSTCIFSSFSVSRIRVWSWKKLKPLAVLTYHTETVNSLDFSPWLEGKGHLMAAGSKDTHISVWSLYNDPKTWKCNNQGCYWTALMSLFCEGVIVVKWTSHSTVSYEVRHRHWSTFATLDPDEGYDIEWKLVITRSLEPRNSPCFIRNLVLSG